MSLLSFICIVSLAFPPPQGKFTVNAEHKQQCHRTQIQEAGDQIPKAQRNAGHWLPLAPGGFSSVLQDAGNGQQGERLWRQQRPLGLVTRVTRRTAVSVVGGEMGNPPRWSGLRSTREARTWWRASVCVLYIFSLFCGRPIRKKGP